MHTTGFSWASPWGGLMGMTWTLSITYLSKGVPVPGTSAHSEDGRSGMKLVPFSLYTDYTLAAC